MHVSCLHRFYCYRVRSSKAVSTLFICKLRRIYKCYDPTNPNQHVAKVSRIQHNSEQGKQRVEFTTALRHSGPRHVLVTSTPYCASIGRCTRPSSLLRMLSTTTWPTSSPLSMTVSLSLPPSSGMTQCSFSSTMTAPVVFSRLSSQISVLPDFPRRPLPI